MANIRDNTCAGSAAPCSQMPTQDFIIFMRLWSRFPYSAARFVDCYVVLIWVADDEGTH